MTTAREIMSPDCTCARIDDSIADAARKMRERNLGALPICGEDQRLAGMVSDRDITVRIVAEGRDPQTSTVAELADGKPVTIGADDSLEDALRIMTDHGVRRLPVIDDHELVGMVSQADLAQAMPEERVGELVALLSDAPANS